MEQIEKEMFKLWSETDEYMNHIKEAKANIEKILKNEKCIILYSGGKDSSVMLHLCMRINKETPVYFFNAGYDYESKQMKTPPEIVSDITENAKLFGVKKLYIRGGYGPKPSRFFGHLSTIKKSLDVDTELLGLRKEESSGRKGRIRNTLVQIEGSRKLGFPIKNLTWKDVWAYIIEHKMKYLSTYDKYAAIVGWDKARFTSLFSKGIIHEGGSYYIDGVIMPEFRNATNKEVIQ